MPVSQKGSTLHALALLSAVNCCCLLPSARENRGCSRFCWPSFSIGQDLCSRVLELVSLNVPATSCMVANLRFEHGRSWKVSCLLLTCFSWCVVCISSGSWARFLLCPNSRPYLFLSLPWKQWNLGGFPALSHQLKAFGLYETAIQGVGRILCLHTPKGSSLSHLQTWFQAVFRAPVVGLFVNEYRTPCVWGSLLD